VTPRIGVDPVLCDGCEACARSCPTGALRVALEGVQTGLVWEIGRCIQCRLCERICPRGAIRFCGMDEGFGERTEGELVLGLVVRACSRCGARFGVRNPEGPEAPDQAKDDERLTLCPRCRRRASAVCRPIWKGEEVS
jgi:formate hydrogenlyase subunit 6/NADH:ubiquinone oxidoreductase subunit I